ncbi:MAG TPA: HAMP domain-containing sensor histidine kinase [Ornithinibacter sp.]|nr:HAMP domain-containing sensor histidine kinase [Ornithinibacter sp.]
MTDRRPLRPLEVRLLTGFLVVSVAAVGVLFVGSVVPHLLAQAGRREAVDTGWLVLATVVALATAIVASILATRRLLTPLAVGLETARAFTAGDHSARVPDLGRPELAELVDALNAAAAEVERSEQDRRRHTADIAHELRTPLTVLQAGLEELRDGLVPPTPGTLAALHDQATRLGRVVDELAELSAVESEGLQLTLAPVDLGMVAEGAIATRARPMTEAGLTWRAELGSAVVVLADVDRLHQVVGNLLANSTAYCRPGDTVVVRVRTDGRHGLLEVVDTGPGLTDDERHRAFDRSWRGRQARGTPGSGLGLPIVRALVLAQGGRVQLSSAVGTGTKVRVALPLAG